MPLGGAIVGHQTYYRYRVSGAPPAGARRNVRKSGTPREPGATGQPEVGWGPAPGLSRRRACCGRQAVLPAW